MNNMLTDINNNNVYGFIIGDDGVVYGHINGVSTSSLSEESCTLIGKNFNEELNICHWSTSPMLNVYQNINKPIINQDFSFVDIKENCDYYFSFDYIYEIKTNELDNINALIQNMNSMDSKIKWNIGATEIVSFDFDTRTILEKITSPEKTGIYATGNFYTQLKNTINNQLNVLIDDSKLRSGWISFRRKLTQEEISQIRNISIGVSITNPFKGVVIKFDNFKIDEVCDVVTTSTRTINNNPSIDFDRIIDNKKSWSVDEKYRSHSVLWRETKYQTNDDREIINSKEIDLALSYTNAIEENFAEYLRENRAFILNLCQQNNDLLTRIDAEIYLNDYTNEELIKRFLNFFNCPSTYRTTSINYLIGAIFDDYMTKNSVSFDNLTKIINKLDKYWVDIIAQFVPSSTIWESNLIYGANNLFRDKFIYPRYNLSPQSEFSLGEPINATITENSSVFNNVPLSFEFYNTGGEYYQSEINIQYNVVMMPIMHHPYSMYYPYQLCGIVNSPLMVGGTYEFVVGGILYEDFDGIQPIVGENQYRRVNFNEQWYAVKINNNGVILDIVNLNTCPVETDIRFVIYPNEYADYDDACSGTIPTRGGITYYAQNFEVGEMIYRNSSLTNADGVIFENNVFYMLIYEGRKYAVRFIHENEIIDLISCDELTAPSTPQITLCEGGAYKLYITLVYQIDSNTEYFEFTIKSTITGDENVVNIPYQSSGTISIPIDTPNYGVGLHTIKVRAFNYDNPIPSNYATSECTAFGYTLYAMRETIVEPCQTFPPTTSIDRTVFSATSNLGEVRRGVQLFTNAEMTQPLIPRSGSKVSLANVEGTQILSTNVNDRGFVTDINFCGGQPVQLEIVEQPFDVAEPSRCAIYDVSNRITVFNDSSLTVGSKFYYDDTLIKPLDMDTFNNRFMMAKVPSESTPRYIYIENGVVAQIGRPCN